MQSKKRCLLALAVVCLAGCSGSSSSKGGTSTPVTPTVSSTTPGSGATGVAANTAISASFSQTMNPATVTASTFTLAGAGSGNVTGSVTYSTTSNTATFTPAATLAYPVVYTATLANGVASTAGLPLAANYIWSFQTAVPTTNGQSVANVDFGTTYQTIRGFGASTAFDAALAPAGANALFGNSNSAQLGLTLLRVRIDPGGQSNWGTELGNAQLATALGANVFASPWSPPIAMKSNNNVVGGTLNPASYAAYASYLQSYVTYMANNGVNLYAISMQNEPDATVTYESCFWTGATMDTWVANNASVLTTRLILPESEGFNFSYSDPALNDANAVGKISIVGGHLYGTTPTYYANAINKGKDVWMTEYLLEPAGTAIVDPGIADGLKAAKLIHDSMTVANYNAYVWWRAQNAGTGATLTTDDGLVDPNNLPNLYGDAIGQYAKFVRPGYVRVSASASPTTGVYVSAYKGSGHYVVVVINQATTNVSQSFTLQNQAVTSLTPYQTTASAGIAQLSPIAVSNNTFTYTLPAQSITTFVQ